MSRSLLIVILALQGCDCCHHNPPPPPQHCPDQAVDDAGISADGPVIDAATIDASYDAMSRPEEPPRERCVAPRSARLVQSCAPDPYEPDGTTNGDMIHASVGAGHECDLTEKDATLADDSDVDVYRTSECSNLIGESLDALTPWAELDVPANPTGDVNTVRLCIFPTCSKGSTNVFTCYDTPIGVDATDGTQPAPDDLYNSEVGYRGCCRVGVGRITAKLECPRHSAAIDTYLWVDTAMPGGGCRSYALRYKMK